MSTIMNLIWDRVFLFQNDSSQLLINLPTKKMSLNLDDDEEFWKWYQTQSDFTFKNPKYLPRFVLAII